MYPRGQAPAYFGTYDDDYVHAPLQGWNFGATDDDYVHAPLSGILDTLKTIVTRAVGAAAPELQAAGQAAKAQVVRDARATSIGKSLEAQAVQQKKDELTSQASSILPYVALGIGGLLLVRALRSR